jgi:hypothetical protein
MIIPIKTKNLKRISLILFLLSITSLVASLWLHNTLIAFKYSKTKGYEEIKIQDYAKYKVICSNNSIEDCRNRYLKKDYSKKLDDCYENNHKVFYSSNKKIYKHRDSFFIDNNFTENDLEEEFIDKEIEVIIKRLNVKKESCIKNSKYFNVYKIFPFYYEFLSYLKLHPKRSVGSLDTINPFINGETSISNIVKRFPINYIFKSLLFISVMFMYLYWKAYKDFFFKILNSKETTFFYFGLASAIFLFFHVLFLGMEIDNKSFKILRKLVITFFILSELTAQFLLTIQLYKNKDNLIAYCNNYIIYLKLLFIIIISMISFFVIALLVIYDLSSKVDYILEWNYFAALLFYYFFSYLMWKKDLIRNPSST